MKPKKNMMYCIWAALILCGGCTSSTAEVQLTMEPDGPGLKVIEAIRDGNFQEYSADFAGENGLMTEEEFRLSLDKMHRQFGEITDIKFLTDLETPLVKNKVWRVSFQRKDHNGKPVRQDLLFRVVSGVSDGKESVFSAGFL